MQTMHRETIWIIGAGKFGRLALKRLSARRKDARFALVDTVETRLSLNDVSEESTVDCATYPVNGVAFLDRYLIPGRDEPSWIVPALPIHLAAEWCRTRFAGDIFGRTTLPPALDALVPNPMRGPDGDLYVSHADFLCPDNCSEPDNLCTVTRKPRKQDMFELLASLSCEDFKPVVIRSHQLAPGVGGYRPEQLFAMLDTVRRTRGNLMICTACRCHGVIGGFRHDNAARGRSVG
jgi:hypothetical protein